MSVLMHQLKVQTSERHTQVEAAAAATEDHTMIQ
jgi:hypothetical protein